MAAQRGQTRGEESVAITPGAHHARGLGQTELRTQAAGSWGLGGLVRRSGGTNVAFLR